jgi:hypothetical protein
MMMIRGNVGGTPMPIHDWSRKPVGMKAYVEPVAVGDPVPEMPVFLDLATYILAPLEVTYLATWETCPEPIRELIIGPSR